MARLRCLQCQAVFDSTAQIVSCPNCKFYAHAGAFYPEPATTTPTHATQPIPATTATPGLPAQPSIAVAHPQQAAASAAAPAHGWVLPVLWLIVLVSFAFESILFLMAGDEAALTEIGLAFTLPLLGLALAGALFCRITIGILTAWDLKAQGVHRLKMAMLPATQYERTSPNTWGWLAGILTIPSLGVLTIMRGKLRKLSRQALTAPQFSDKKQMKASLKKKDFFPKADVKAMKGRQTVQAFVFLGLLVVLWVVSRL